MLRPVEFVYLATALAIVAWQIAVSDHGAFNPAAAGVALAFIALIPAGRADRKADASREGFLVRLLRLITGENGKGGGS